MSESDRPIVQAGLLKRVGNIEPTNLTSDLDQRLLVQKTVSLLQDAAEIDLGFPFNWYLRGPYSPPLARDAYAMVSVYDQAPVRHFDEPKLESNFQWFIGWLHPNARDARFMEILASLVFLIRRKDVYNADQALSKMREKIPDLSMDDFRQVWNMSKSEPAKATA